MKRFLLKWAVIAFAAVQPLCFVSCDSDNDTPTVPPAVSATGCYIINVGNWNANDASVQYYDYATGNATSPLCESDLFASSNGVLLGDLAQDMLWVGEKLFVSVSGSQKLEVLDESGKRLCAPYTYEGEGNSPRMMVTDGNRVYVTNYDGNVYVYDVATADFVRTIPVGVRPEGISLCDGYLVVNNSGDMYAYNGSVSIVDLDTYETKNIPLVNPYTQSVVCNGEVYIIDSGNYVDVPSSIYRVSPSEATVESLGVSAALIAAYENYLYYVNSVYNYSTWAFEYSPLYRMDVTTGEVVELLSAESMANVNSLSVNPADGSLFVGYAEYGVLGTMRVYSPDGTQTGVFDVGYYTGGARFAN